MKGITNAQNGGGTRRVTLWTNDSPQSDFAAQYVNLSESLDNYDSFQVEYLWDKGNANSTFIQEFSHIGYGEDDTIAIYIPFVVNASGYFRISFRRLSAVNATKIHFKDNSLMNTSSTVTTDNTRCIPCKIYGVKY